MVETLWLVGAYLFGSVPFGVLVARAHSINIQEVGSGNIGATNIYRSLGFFWAAAVGLLDAFKVGAIVLAARLVGETETMQAAIGVAGTLGHMFSIFLRFKGGKAVSVYGGILWAISPWVALTLLFTWLPILLLVRMVSLINLLTLLILIGVLWAVEGEVFGWFALIETLLIFWAHRSNLVRLWRGEEKKIQVKASSKKIEEKS